MHALQHSVQRLISVGLGDGDVVLEFPGHRFIEAVHHTQSAVAVIDRVDDQTEGKDIHDLRKGLPLGFHLVVDAVEVFFSSHDSGSQPLAVQCLAQLISDLVDKLLPVAAC